MVQGYALCGGVAAKDFKSKFFGKSETFRTSDGIAAKLQS
jgi:hypothetical protein